MTALPPPRYPVDPVQAVAAITRVFGELQFALRARGLFGYALQRDREGLRLQLADMSAVHLAKLRSAALLLAELADQEAEER